MSRPVHTEVPEPAWSLPSARPRPPAPRLRPPRSPPRRRRPPPPRRPRRRPPPPLPRRRRRPQATTTTTAPKVAAPAPPPAGPVPSGSEASFLACVRQRESHGDYTAVDPSGTFMGAYQIYQGGWDAVARSIGRSDPSGVRPNRAADQDTIVLAMLRQTRAGPPGAGPAAGPAPAASAATLTRPRDRRAARTPRSQPEPRPRPELRRRPQHGAPHRPPGGGGAR